MGCTSGTSRVSVNDPAVTLPAEYQPMAELLEVILDDLGKLYGDLPRRLDDATWVGCRFAEILPMPLEQKQHCLQLTDPAGAARIRPADAALGALGNDAVTSATTIQAVDVPDLRPHLRRSRG